VEPTGIAIDSKSGVSGAGRKLEIEYLFAELDENALLEQALDRRLRHGLSLSDPAVFRRVHRYLLGQGFDPGRVTELLRRRAKSL